MRPARAVATKRTRRDEVLMVGSLAFVTVCGARVPRDPVSLRCPGGILPPAALIAVQRRSTLPQQALCPRTAPARHQRKTARPRPLPGCYNITLQLHQRHTQQNGARFHRKSMAPRYAKSLSRCSVYCVQRSRQVGQNRRSLRCNDQVPSDRVMPVWVCGTGNDFGTGAGLDLQYVPGVS
jgi:hypothetical protein